MTSAEIQLLNAILNMIASLVEVPKDACFKIQFNDYTDLELAIAKILKANKTASSYSTINFRVVGTSIFIKVG